jgi:hypothetical protein
MLNNPNWDKKATTDPLTLDALKAWLKTKPPEEHYEFADSHTCLAAQYNESIGREYELPSILCMTRMLQSPFSKTWSFDHQLEWIGFHAMKVKVKAFGTNFRNFGKALELTEELTSVRRR